MNSNNNYINNINNINNIISKTHTSNNFEEGILKNYNEEIEGYNKTLEELFAKIKTLSEPSKELRENITSLSNKLNEFGNLSNLNNNTVKERFSEILLFDGEYKELKKESITINKFSEDLETLLVNTDTFITNIKGKASNIIEKKVNKGKLMENLKKAQHIVSSQYNGKYNRKYFSRSTEDLIYRLNVINNRGMDLLNIYNNKYSKYINKNNLMIEELEKKIRLTKNNFKVSIINYYIQKYESLYSKKDNINFNNHTDKNILELLLNIKTTISELDTDLDYLNKTIIINKNNKNINNSYTKFKDVLLKFKTYLTDNIKKLQERLTTDIDKINKGIRIHIDAIIELIDKFNKTHNNNTIYKTNGLNDYKKSLDKYKSNLDSSVKNNYFNKLLANIEKGLNPTSIINSLYNTNEESLESNNSNTKILINILNNKFKKNDIISWVSPEGKKKYGIIIGTSDKGDKYLKIKRVDINNNNVTNKKNNVHLIIDKEIIKDNNLIVKKIGTYNPTSRKIIRSKPLTTNFEKNNY